MATYVPPNVNRKYAPEDILVPPAPENKVELEPTEDLTLKLKAPVVAVTFDIEMEKVQGVEKEVVYRVSKHADGSISRVKMIDENDKENAQDLEEKQDKGFALKDKSETLGRVKKLSDRFDNERRMNPAFMALEENRKQEIEKDNNLQKLLRCVHFGDSAGVNNLLVSGKVHDTMLNMDDGVIMKMAVNNGNMDMAKLLIEKGANPNAIDPKNCHDPLMADFIQSEIDKKNAPVMTTLRSAASSLGLMKPSM